MCRSTQKPTIVGHVLPQGLPDLGVDEPVPILDLPVADQRKWCRPAQDWLDRATITTGCRLLQAGGVCRLSPAGGRCLLLLPFTHRDWQPALRWRYDLELGAMVDREEPAALPERAPLALETLREEG